MRLCLCLRLRGSVRSHGDGDSACDAAYGESSGEH
jgi:hypothetical protein